MKKILLIFGTRPEAIKLCCLAAELKTCPDKFKVTICVTAQHREMLDQVLNLFDIKPDYDLNLMQKNQTLFDITSSCLIEVGKVMDKEKPDIVLLQGDTTTTFAASLAAYYNKVCVAHVEAGLRTYNKYSPYPEEMNRKLTTAIADLHFAPTQRNKENLISEGIPEKSITVTGNTVIDALFWVRNKIETENRKYEQLDCIDFNKKIILVTGHRRENFGQGFINICHALRNIAKKNKNAELVYPVHLNPNVRQPVNEILSEVENIKLIEPLDYEAFVYLMDKSYLIITDSGGIQEEAPSIGKPVLVTRDKTERSEAVEVGTVKLVGTDTDRIVMETETLLRDSESYRKMSEMKNPYGDGDACKKIKDALLAALL